MFFLNKEPYFVPSSYYPATLKNGQLVDKQVGVVPKAALAAKLDAQIK